MDIRNFVVAEYGHIDQFGKPMLAGIVTALEASSFPSPLRLAVLVEFSDVPAQWPQFAITGTLKFSGTALEPVTDTHQGIAMLDFPAFDPVSSNRSPNGVLAWSPFLTIRQAGQLEVQFSLGDGSAVATRSLAVTGPEGLRL